MYAIAVAVLTNVANVFPALKEHMFDTAIDENHVFSLIKLVSSCYSTIRLHHLAKVETEKNSGSFVRKN